MKHIIKKIAATGVAALLVAGTVTAVSAARVESNRVIAKTSANTMELYSIEGKRLLFTFGSVSGESADGTSKFYVSVDNEFENLYTEDTADNETYTITGSTQLNNVDITKHVQIIPNSVNGNLDTVEFSTVFTNNTEEAHTVACRIFLDTMVEDNDYAPFRVTGVGSIENRTQFEGNDIPESFQAFNSLSNPSMIGTGSFAKGAGKPDIVQFTSYGANSGTLIPECDPSRTTGDSAVNAIWTNRTLAPGESFVCTAYYGIGLIDIQESNELILGATRNTSSFTVNEDGTGYNPIKLTGYVSNNGTGTLNSVAMTLNVPDGVSCGEATVSYPELNVRAEKQHTWTLEAAPSAVEKTVTVTLEAESAETGKVEPMSYTFTIPAIEGVEPEPTTEPATTVPETTVEETTVAETTVAPTTVPATTSATKDEATKSEATKSEAANGAVQTGQAIPAAMILVVLLAAVGVLYFMRRKEN
ncbi:MAG: hypothetical protein IJ598_00060 [Ruminococcus sp.]|nr:hypothetical protein [Ruminococcus sp.]